MNDNPTMQDVNPPAHMVNFLDPIRRKFMCRKICNDTFVVAVAESDSDNTKRNKAQPVFSGGMCRCIIEGFVGFMFKIDTWLSHLDFVSAPCNKTFDFDIKFRSIRIFVFEGGQDTFGGCEILGPYYEAHVFPLELGD